jgi:hypothetical protein
MKLQAEILDTLNRGYPVIYDVKSIHTWRDDNRPRPECSEELSMDNLLYMLQRDLKKPRAYRRNRVYFHSGYFSIDGMSSQGLGWHLTVKRLLLNGVEIWEWGE